MTFPGAAGSPIPLLCREMAFFPMWSSSPVENVPATAMQWEGAKSDELGGLQQGERGWNMACVGPGQPQEQISGLETEFFNVSVEQ